MEQSQLAPPVELVQRLEFAGWALKHDPDATAEVYARIASSGCEDCACEGCFNYADARHLIYPTDLLDLFECLGIDPTLESEVVYRHRIRQGWHAYSGWFHLVGTIESGPTSNLGNNGSIENRFLAPAVENVSLAFSCDRRLAPDAFADVSVVELELALPVPWVCDGQEPE